MPIRPHPTRSGLSLRLTSVTTIRGRSRSAMAPTLPAVTASTMANVPIVVDVLAPSRQRWPEASRVSQVRSVTAGTAVVQGTNAVSFTSNRLFTGPTSFTVEVVDLAGGKASARVDVTVAANPAIGVPFSDGAFFSDNTGLDLA